MRTIRLKHYLLIPLVCIVNVLYAQTKLPPEGPDTNSVQGIAQYVLAKVDKTQIPTQCLAEYGAQITPMATFNGTLSTNNLISSTLWRTLYFQIQTSYVGSAAAPFPDIRTVNASIGQSTMNTPVIPIPLLIGTYNSLKSTAVSANLLSFNSTTKQFADVPGRTQSPYQANTLFAASPNSNTCENGSAQFICNPSLIWNNTGKTISSISIDFSNGLGFKTIPLNKSVTVSYATAGIKQWTIKVTLSDNSVLQCYSSYYVQTASPNGNMVAFNQKITLGKSSLCKVPVSLQLLNSDGKLIYPYDNAYVDDEFSVNVSGTSGGTAFVKYSSTNTSKKLKKTLIVIEGFDIFSIAPDIQTSPLYYSDFMYGLDNASSTKYATPYNFNQQLDDYAGYDIVYLMFTNGTDYIENNAKVVEQLISIVNAKKAPDVSNDNVVMGLSMGGLCARYALAEMTKNNQPTETRLLITHDSPHEGANIPLGLQYFMEMMSNFNVFGYSVTDIYPQYHEALGILNAPATKELLLYTATGTNTYQANTFLNTTYRNMITFSSTGPQPTYKFIATSLGSQCGQTYGAPGATFFNGTAFAFAGMPGLGYGIHVTAEAYALPNQGTIAKIARLNITSETSFLFFDWTKTLYNNIAYSTGNELPVDEAPGSIAPYIAESQYQTVPGISAGFWFLIGFSVQSAPVNVDFCFVPTASALDISPFGAAAFNSIYVSGVNGNFPSTASNYIAQEYDPTNSPTPYNNEHIVFTPRNARWIFDQMENVTENSTCSSDCTPVFSITGPDLTCSSATYTADVPVGGTITWTASPANIATITSANNLQQITLSRFKISSGIVTLTATITSPCYGATVITKQIQVGILPAPTYISGFLNNGQTFVNNASYEFQSSGNTWTSTNSTITTGQGTSFINVQMRSLPNPNSLSYPFTLSVAQTNACGTSAYFVRTGSIIAGTGIRTQRPAYEDKITEVEVYPNPAQTTVTITIPPDSMNIVQANIIFSDITGRIVKRITTISQSNIIDISDLTDGIYFIQITDGEKRYVEKIIKD